MVVFSLILVYGVIIVNGWSDSPNSIATAVSSGAIKYKTGVVLCAFFNLAGVISGYFIDTSVAKFVFTLNTSTEFSHFIVCISLFTMIVFGTVLSIIGLPSSESHSMIASMVGASFYLSQDAKYIKNLGEVFIFTVFSCILAFAVSYLARKIFKWNLPYKRLQYLSSSLNAIMHGYQSGLKFLGVIIYLLGLNLDDKISLFPICVSIGISLFFGTLIGGKKIIESMGENLVSISDVSSFSSDIGTYLSLLICSLMGMPVSTGNVKCLSIMGVGVCEKRKINKKTTTKLLISFIIVFPICFFAGYFLMSLVVNF